MRQNSILFRCAQALEQSVLTESQVGSDRPGVLFWQLAIPEQFDAGVLLKRYYRYPAGDIEMFSRRDGTVTLYLDIVDREVEGNTILGYTIWNIGIPTVHINQISTPVSSAIVANDFQFLLNCLPLHQLLRQVDQQLNGLICGHLRDMVAQDLQECTIIGSSEEVQDLHRDLLDKIMLADMP